jgi:hypothetical protein
MVIRTRWLTDKDGWCTGYLGREVVLRVDVGIWNCSMMLKASIREVVERLVDCWNSSFEGAEETVVDFCCFIALFSMV